MIGLKYMFLTFAICYTYSNTFNAIFKRNVTMAQLMIMSFSIAGFLFCCEIM